MSRWWILATLALLLISWDARAQQPSASAPRSGFDPPGSLARPLDLSTPRQAIASFLQAVDARQLDRAARVLDLRGLHWDEHTPHEAAEQLAIVLERRVWLDLHAISDLPEGQPEDGADLERIAVVETKAGDIPITLARVRRGDGMQWLISSATVARIPELTAALGPSSWVTKIVPTTLGTNRWMGLWPWQWVGFLIAIGIGFPLGLLLATLLSAALRRIASSTTPRWDDALVIETRGTLRFALGWLLMGLVALSLDLPRAVEAKLELVVATPLILATGWFLRRCIQAITGDYLANVTEDQERHTRGLRTQIVILRKLSTVAIALVTAAIALMQFDVVRNVGWSLLASAGVAGVAIGLAAKSSLGAVIAGLQLSMTQPIRLGDAIIIQGQWGTVEEIALTYVRVKLGDERRLVVPIEKFLTETFENWSQPGDQMIGLVELPVDPSAPIPKIREELQRLAKDHPAHDGRECKLQLVELSETRALLRARVSTSDISRVFGMRCEIRERLLEFVRELDGGRFLPHQRVRQLREEQRSPVES